MELVFYLLGLMNTLLVIFTRSKAAATSLLFVIVAYVVSARLAPPEVDMAVYYNYISAFRPYMIKEFLYYGVTSSLYYILQDRNLVFIIVDLAALGLLRAFVLPELGRMRTNLFLALLFFSFVGVMGFQNVYRQYLASILMTVGFLSMDQKKRKSVFIATFSACLVHNASVLVAMILLMKSISKAFVQKNIIYFGVGLLIAALLFVYFTFMVRLKSNRDTGANMLLFYFMISALFVLIFGHRLTTHKGILLRSAVFLILLLPIFMISGGSTGGERIFMFVFPIFLYEVLKNSRHSIFSDRVVELVLFIIFCGPTLAVFSSRQFLT